MSAQNHTRRSAELPVDPPVIAVMLTPGAIIRTALEQGVSLRATALVSEYGLHLILRGKPWPAVVSRWDSWPELRPMGVPHAPLEVVDAAAWWRPCHHAVVRVMRAVKRGDLDTWARNSPHAAKILAVVELTAGSWIPAAAEALWALMHQPRYYPAWQNLDRWTRRRLYVLGLWPPGLPTPDPISIEDLRNGPRP
jgi:hypothetical protein